MSSFDLGKRIQSLLDEREKSQSDLARYLGIKPSTISQWISGKANPTFDKLETIARFFRMSLPDLVSDKDSSETSSPAITVINAHNDLFQIPLGSYIRVEIGTEPQIGDIVLYKTGDLLRFLRLAAYKDGISVLMSDIDGDPPVIATNKDTEIIGTATAILLNTKEEPALDGISRADCNSENKDYQDYNITIPEDSQS